MTRRGQDILLGGSVGLMVGILPGLLAAGAVVTWRLGGDLRDDLAVTGGFGHSSTRRSFAAWMTTARMLLSLNDRGDEGTAIEVGGEVVADELSHRSAGFDRA